MPGLEIKNERFWWRAKGILDTPLPITIGVVYPGKMA